MQNTRHISKSIDMMLIHNIADNLNGLSNQLTKLHDENLIKDNLTRTEFVHDSVIYKLIFRLFLIGLKNKDTNITTRNTIQLYGLALIQKIEGMLKDAAKGFPVGHTLQKQLQITQQHLTELKKLIESTNIRNLPSLSSIPKSLQEFVFTALKECFKNFDDNDLADFLPLIEFFKLKIKNNLLYQHFFHDLIGSDDPQRLTKIQQMINAKINVNTEFDLEHELERTFLLKSISTLRRNDNSSKQRTNREIFLLLLQAGANANYLSLFRFYSADYFAGAWLIIKGADIKSVSKWELRSNETREFINDLERFSALWNEFKVAFEQSTDFVSFIHCVMRNDIQKTERAVLSLNKQELLQFKKECYQKVLQEVIQKQPQTVEQLEPCLFQATKDLEESKLKHTNHKNLANLFWYIRNWGLEYLDQNKEYPHSFFNDLFQASKQVQNNNNNVPSSFTQKHFLASKSANNIVNNNDDNLDRNDNCNNNNINRSNP